LSSESLTSDSIGGKKRKKYVLDEAMFGIWVHRIKEYARIMLNEKQRNYNHLLTA
jgi:hypothetical protein